MIKVACAFAALLLCPPANAAAAPEDVVQSVRGTAIPVLLRDQIDGKAVAEIVRSPSARVFAILRGGDGAPEVHVSETDILIVRSGAATLLVGGDIEGATEMTAGEFRGGTIKNGRKIKMATGDVIYVPAGIPHQMLIPTGGKFEYLAIKNPAAGR